MKKEEIDDRLMDALLRGKSEEDLASGVDDEVASKVRRGNFVRTVLAAAAMVLFAAIAVFYSKKGNDEGTESPTLVADYAAEREANLAELEALIEEQEAEVEAKRKVLDTIARITGRPYFEGSSNSPQTREAQSPMIAESTTSEMTSEQLLVMEENREENSSGLVELAAEIHDFKGATKDYEAALAELQNAKLKHARERVAVRHQGGLVSAGSSEGLSEVERMIPPLPPLPNSSMAQVIGESSDFGSPSDFGAGWGDEERFQEIGRQIRRLEGGNAQVQEQNAEQYGTLTDQPWKDPRKEALSTFSVDVDTASYTNIRRMLKDGVAVPKDAVRIEELVNYFDYKYPQPDNGEAFGVGLEMATCPWEPKHNLVRVALQGKEVNRDERGDANLVFLIDVSGSMQDSDKLPLLVESLGLMVEELREDDRVTIVVYAGSEGVVLPPTKMGQGGREKVAAALGKLSAGGSTNGGAGIELAYRLAKENLVTGGINRVILATDGDFNVGTTSQEALVELVKKEAEEGVFLSVCGFGRGNLNDSMLEAITNEGNGVYYYIDSIAEGRRVFLEKLMGTLVTIAKDVKIQVEFNPAKVGQYRLIGYANRVLKKEDFNNDQVDAGDIGSGHQVTAFYEIIPAGVTGTVRPEVDDLKYQEESEAQPQNDLPDWMTVKLRHKEPEGEVSKLQEFVLQGNAKPWTETDGDFQFASGVALWGMGLRGMLDGAGRLSLQMLKGALNGDSKRVELVELLEEEGKFAEEGLGARNETDLSVRFVFGSLKGKLEPGTQLLVDLDGVFEGEGPGALFMAQAKEGGEWKTFFTSRFLRTRVEGKTLRFLMKNQRVRVIMGEATE